MQIRRLGVVGHPIAHSLSPTLHQAAHQALGVADCWDYSAHDVQPDSLSQFVAGLDISWRGLSVTMPHKPDARKLSNNLDAMAEMTGSVNTLLFVDHSGERVISGFNTDVFGIVAAMQSISRKPFRHVAIIGSGATAASSVVAAAELGAEDVSIIARNPVKADYLTSIGEQAGLVVNVVLWGADVTEPRPDAVISTVPGSVDVDMSQLWGSSESVLLDVAYDPWPSTKAVQWSLLGGKYVSGLVMLAEQALIQERIFINGNPFTPLTHEEYVRQSMYASVGLN